MNSTKFTEIRSEFFEYFKTLTPEQLAEMAETMPVANPEGHMISDKNTAFLQFQNSEMKFTVIAGYKQWMRYGRGVKKGSHGFWIFIPAMTKTKVEGKTVEEFDRFLMARVFDVSQTYEIKEPVEEKKELALVEEPDGIYNEDEEEPDCSCCSPACRFFDSCDRNQDPDLGCTGHGDISWSDADPGL